MWPIRSQEICDDDTEAQPHRVVEENAENSTCSFVSVDIFSHSSSFSILNFFVSVFVLGPWGKASLCTEQFPFPRQTQCAEHEQNKISCNKISSKSIQIIIKGFRLDFFSLRGAGVEVSVHLFVFHFLGQTKLSLLLEDSCSTSISVSPLQRWIKYLGAVSK